MDWRKKIKAVRNLFDRNNYIVDLNELKKLNTETDPAVDAFIGYFQRTSSGPVTMSIILHEIAGIERMALGRHVDNFSLDAEMLAKSWEHMTTHRENLIKVLKRYARRIDRDPDKVEREYRILADSLQIWGGTGRESP